MDIILERIIELMEEKSISQITMCEKLNINRSSFTHWKNGVNQSYKKKINEIANILEVEPIVLLGGKVSNKSNLSLTREEKDIIALYRKLNEEEKGKVNKYILSLLLGE